MPRLSIDWATGPVPPAPGEQGGVSVGRFRGLFARTFRVRYGIDSGDLPPGQEFRHLSGRAYRRALREGLINPDGSTRTGGASAGSEPPAPRSPDSPPGVAESR